MSLPTLIVVGGPTASGKTALAIELARHYGTEIVSGDSRQFYRELRIGNARPSPAELAAVPHHFVADRSIIEPLSAGRFAAAALPVVADLQARYGTAVLVGGSGLYLTALAEGLDEFPPVTEAARARVREIERGGGTAALARELDRRDPDYARRVDRSNPRRLQRALRVCLSAGRPYSDFLGRRPPRPFRPVYLRPHPDRATLYARIDARVDRMLDEGLEAEARTVHPHRELTTLQTVGYREWWPYFAGEYDRARAVELIKRNSRRYAKRQVTWFGRGERYRTVGGLTEAIHWVNSLP